MYQICQTMPLLWFKAITSNCQIERARILRRTIWSQSRTEKQTKQRTVNQQFSSYTTIQITTDWLSCLFPWYFIFWDVWTYTKVGQKVFFWISFFHKIYSFFVSLDLVQKQQHVVAHTCWTRLHYII